MADFQQQIGEFEGRNVKVAAASVDPLDEARKTVDRHKLTYPLGYGIPLREVAAATGAFYEEARGIIHATSFVVKPDRTIANACYSSGPIGRIMAKDCIGLIDYVISKR